MARDPFASFLFKVEIDGITQAGFSECSGLQAETEFDEIREGGLNEYVHRLPKRTKYVPLTLKRGLTDSDELWNWYQDVVGPGGFKRKRISVILVSAADQTKEKWRRTFDKAYPVKWVGPEMKADSSAVAIETLEFVHHGFVNVTK